jgi:hypothetical protein
VQNAQFSSLWAYLERHGKCLSDSRFGDLETAIREQQQTDGVWTAVDVDTAIKKHDAAKQAGPGIEVGMCEIEG